jgi:hypothetical protein
MDNVCADRDPVAHAGPPSRRELVGEIVDVLHDLPVLLTAPLYRRWHLKWGATDDEVVARLPGDARVANARYRSTRAITIDAPPAAVWPWLVQVGCNRAGFYSNDLLDNLGRPSATTILPAFERLTVGQWVPMSPAAIPTDRTALRVDSFVVDEWLLWVKWTARGYGGLRRRPTAAPAWSPAFAPGTTGRIRSWHCSACC